MSMSLSKYFIRNEAILKQTEISIAIIERDLPCGAIAIKSLQDMFENINPILETEDQLVIPKINLTIFEKYFQTFLVQ